MSLTTLTAAAGMSVAVRPTAVRERDISAVFEWLVLHIGQSAAGDVVWNCHSRSVVITEQHRAA